MAVVGVSYQRCGQGGDESGDPVRGRRTASASPAGVYVDTRVGSCVSLVFFFNDPATTEIYTLSLHDALPISPRGRRRAPARRPLRRPPPPPRRLPPESARPSSPHCRGWCSCGSAAWWRCRCGSRHQDRKSTRLNSSHLVISYAVFCLKKKKRK